MYKLYGFDNKNSDCEEKWRNINCYNNKKIILNGNALNII